MRPDQVKACAVQLRKWMSCGVAASIRLATTECRAATVDEMVEAGKQFGLNSNTIRKQFTQARREDAEVDAAQAAEETQNGHR